MAIERSYLLALLDADRLFTLGIEWITHWSAKPARDYADILAGKQLPLPQSPVALENDVEVQDVVQPN
eukprot:573933-Alexandrium_andersonii.AAC.1